MKKLLGTTSCFRCTKSLINLVMHIAQPLIQAKLNLEILAKQTQNRNEVERLRISNVIEFLRSGMSLAWFGGVEQGRQNFF